jgi:hypothetical protein
MSDFTQLEIANPIITPAVPEILWDRLWIDTLTITSPEVNKVTLYCKMIPCRDLPSGEKELKPMSTLTQEEVKVVTIDNLWVSAYETPSLAMAMEAVFQAVNEYGKKVGVILTPDSSSSSSEVLSSSDSSGSSLGTSGV